ncbi:MAG: FKBP-type peptidyl-prolyl cis-trans isomerase [Myxococcota bacterium]
MRRPVVATLLFCLALACPASTSPVLETDDQKTIYVLGAMLARQVAQFQLSEQEVEILSVGIADALAEREPQVDIETYGPKIDGLVKSRLAATASEESGASMAFVTAAASEAGARTTDSGLVYRETLAGSGENPSATDKVRVHYHGTLRDGTVFDSSVDRGVPAEFALNRVIPCWTEALQLMKPGGKATIICPADIAYGDRGQGQIKPGAALRFDVELIEVQ